MWEMSEDDRLTEMLSTCRGQSVIDIEEMCGTRTLPLSRLEHLLTPVWPRVVSLASGPPALTQCDSPSPRSRSAALRVSWDGVGPSTRPRCLPGVVFGCPPRTGLSHANVHLVFMAQVPGLKQN